MKRNKFNLSKYWLTGMDGGWLTPLNLVEVLPGDTFQGRTTALIRAAPMVAPLMHPTHITIHHWFCPWRLVWNEWEDFITGTSAPAVPQVNVPNTDEGLGQWNRLFDYFGIQRIAVGNARTVSALPFRVYNKIYNEFYRDEQIQSTPLAEDQTTLQRVSWSKDRFTSARIAPQLGGAVSIPTSGASVTAESIRISMALLRLREARNRYGSRYTEYLRYLGVTPSDARLQRPEFLGGGKQTIQWSEVLQTSPTDGQPLGMLGGHGIAGVRSNQYRRFFTEHGLLMTLAFIRPVNIYATGCDPIFRKISQSNFWQREYEQLGMTAMARSELSMTGLDANDNAPFGFQDIYDEYRHSQSRAVNSFTLNPNRSPPVVGEHWDWSFARALEAPVLNTSMTLCIPRANVFAEQQDLITQHYAVLAQHHLAARRLVGKGAKSIIK